MFRVLLIFALLAAPAIAHPAQSREVSADNPAEFMIYQYPDIALVVKIEAPETEFTSSIYGPEDALVASSGIPSGRIGPLYQYIPASDISRQLMIKISPGRTVDRSKIRMELIQLSDRDRNSPAYSRAYQLFTNGTSLVHSNDTTTWAMKIYTLRNAAQAFASLGWEEMRLWSEFYAAHLVYYKLNDVLLALELAQEVQNSARRIGGHEIELAALILEAEALMSAGSASSGEMANARLEQAHGIFDRIVILAGQLEFRSEQARALFNDGLTYQQQGLLEAAVTQFQKALDVSLSTDNLDLVNQIRSTAADVYETQGSTAGAIEMLEDIGQDLGTDAGTELTENLFERGRILNSNYRFPEAAAELSEALALQKSDASVQTWGPTGLELGWSHFSMGELKQAENLVLESAPRTSRAASAGALIRAYGSLASIYRDRGEFRQMEHYREKQQALIDSDASRAAFLFESGMDAWRRAGANSAQALELLRQSGQVASKSGLELSRHRSAIYLCLLKLEQGGRGACTAESVSGSHDALINSAVPWMLMDAVLVKTRILQRQGRNREALASMYGLLEDLLFYRRALPGVLGAWYWQNRVTIFREYMTVTLAVSGSRAGQRVDGSQALIALDHIWQIDAEINDAGYSMANGEGGDESLRSLLAQRETGDQADVEQLVVQINRGIRLLQKEFTTGVAPLTQTSLETLLAGLNRDEILLSYYFDPAGEYALVASRKGVTLQGLRGTRGAVERLRGSRVSDGGNAIPGLSELDAIGAALLGPVADLLSNRIYLLPSGDLTGFPFDALRLEGEFLAANHTVVKLMSLASVQRRRPLLAADYRGQVFLAGSPQASQELFSYDMPVSAELAALTDMFVGPGLNIVQGVALRRDEFRDSRFTSSSLIHLAIPGTLDLAYPAQSRLQMSSAGSEAASQDLAPADINTLELEASLVVLSQTGTVSGSRSGFDSRLGFVSDILEAGAANVLASLWPTADSETAVFMREFYRTLDSDPDLVEALSGIRKSRMKSGGEANLDSWAGFQLYIR